MNYSALTWVKTTIDENLKQTRQTLEQFVEYPSETTLLQQCIMWLRETHGVLKVLELETAVLLVQELELSIKSLQTGKIENNESTYAVLMRALIQLPNYLDHLAIVQRDIPLALLPLLNELRAYRSETPLAANNLFTPNLSIAIPHPKAVNLSDAKLKEYMQKMRAAYQKGLAAIVKAPKQPEKGLKFLYTVMQHLQQATGAAPVSKVWWITEGIVEALLQKGLEINKSIFNLLKQLDALINHIVQHGNAALRADPPKTLLTNLLYFAAQARSKGSQITAVKTTFQLNDYLPPESTIAAAKLVFAGPDIELMEKVVTLLKDDFVRVEETLDIFNRADNPSVTELSPLVEKLGDMANTLELLGLTVQSQSMQTQAKLILDISEGVSVPEFSTLFEIANALLKIDAAVDMLAVQGVHARQRLSLSPDTEFSHTPQFGIVLNEAVDFAKKELAEIIQALVTFIDTETPDDNLLKVPERLKEVEGFLSISSHERVAQLLAQCQKYIEQVFIKESTRPEEEKLQALGDVLIGIELYLDTLAGNPMEAEALITVISHQLSVISNQ
jgi:chemosensory pili system protein ChpA (sensor histidine kinase/response regulator)